MRPCNPSYREVKQLHQGSGNPVAYPEPCCCHTCAKQLGSCSSRSKQTRPLLSPWHRQKNPNTLRLTATLKAPHTKEWGSLNFRQEQLPLMWSGQPGWTVVWGQTQALTPDWHSSHGIKLFGWLWPLQNIMRKVQRYMHAEETEPTPQIARTKVTNTTSA